MSESRSFTEDDKKKCARIYTLLTGNDSDWKKWNPKAGDLLAEMVSKTKECTNDVRLVMWGLKAPRKIPPGWFWLAGIAWHALTVDGKFHSKKGYTKVAKGCLDVAILNYDTSIQAALAGIY